MGPTVRLRSHSAQVLGVVMVAVAVAGLASAVWGGVDTLLQYGAPVVLFGVVGWGAFWQPSVEVSDGGVTLVNTLRSIHVPWPAIQAVDGRYGLRLTTAYGTMSAWAAQAPAGRQRARGMQSPSSELVTERLQTLREAGHLDDPRLERPAPVTEWHWPLLAALGILTLASVLLPALA